MRRSTLQRDSEQALRRPNEKQRIQPPQQMQPSRRASSFGAVRSTQCAPAATVRPRRCKAARSSQCPVSRAARRMAAAGFAGIVELDYSDGDAHGEARRAEKRTLGEIADLVAIVETSRFNDPNSRGAGCESLGERRTVAVSPMARLAVPACRRTTTGHAAHSIRVASNDRPAWRNTHFVTAPASSVRNSSSAGTTFQKNSVLDLGKTGSSGWVASRARS